MAKKRQRQATSSSTSSKTTPIKKKKIKPLKSPPSSSSSSKSKSAPTKTTTTATNPPIIQGQNLEQSILSFLQHQHQNNHKQRKHHSKIIDDDERAKLSSDILFQGAIGLTFLENNEQGEDKQKKKNGDDDNDVNFTSSVSTLLSYLLQSSKSQDENNTTTNEIVSSTISSSISKIHIANLMLPWVVESLITSSKKQPTLYNDDDNKNENDDTKSLSLLSNTIILWKTFSTCLEILLLDKVHEFNDCYFLSNENNEKKNKKLDVNMLNIIQQILDKTTKTKTTTTTRTDAGKDGLKNILTQGTLNKIIPFAIESALKHPQTTSSSTTTSNRDLINVYATRCCCLIMMSSYYRPTMDLMCKSIIPLANDMIQSSKDDDNKNDDDDDDDDKRQRKFCETIVSFAILKQVESLQQVGRATNPKKNFIALSSTTILCALMKLGHSVPCSLDDYNNNNDDDGDLCTNEKMKALNEMNSTLLKEILYNGLFHVEHHIEGFCTLRYSIPSSSSKKGSKIGTKSYTCYQEKIFESIQSIYDISLKNDKNQDNNNHGKNLNLVPILIEGFMKQSTQYSKNLQNNNNNNSLSSSNKKISSFASVDKLASTQFRFWSNVFHPLLDLLRKSTKKEDELEQHHDYSDKILQSMNQSLELLAQNDSYLPSYSDPDNEHINYLTMIGEVILDLMEKQVIKSSGTRSSSSSLSSHYYKTLEILLNLNHHIFHRKLSRIFGLIAQIDSFAQNDSKDASSLVSSLCSIYEKLRHLSHLLRALLSYFDKRILDENFDKPVGNVDKSMMKVDQKHTKYTFLFNDIVFVQSLTDAISSIPSGQIQEIWQIFDNSLSLVERDEQNTEVIVDFFVIFLKAIEVTQFNAKQVMKCCEVTMQTIVSKLIRVEEMDDVSNSSFDVTCPLTNTGLYLCGWTVRVYNNCSFWLTDIPNDSRGIQTSYNQQICGLILAPALLNTVISELKFHHAENVDKERGLGSLQHLSSHRIEQLHSNIHLQQQYEDFDTTPTEDQNCQSKSMVNEAKTLVDFLIRSAQNRCIDNNSSISVGNKAAGWKIIAQTLSSWIPYATLDHIDRFLEWIFFTLATREESNSNDSSRQIHTPGLNEKLSILLSCEERSVAIALLHDSYFFEVPQINERFPIIALKCVKALLQSNLDARGLQFLQSDNLSINDLDELIKVKIGTPSCDTDLYNKGIIEIIEIMFKVQERLLFKSSLQTILDSTLCLGLLMDKIISHQIKNGCYESVTDKVEMTCKLRKFIAHMLSRKSEIHVDSNLLKFQHLLKHILEIDDELMDSNIQQCQRAMIMSSASALINSLMALSLKATDKGRLFFSSISEAFRSSSTLIRKIGLLGPVLHELKIFQRYQDFGLSLEPIVELSIDIMKEVKQKFEESDSKITSLKSSCALILCITDSLNLLCEYGNVLDDSGIEIEWFVKTFYAYYADSVKSNSEKLSGEELISSMSYFLCFVSKNNVHQLKILDAEIVVNDLQSMITLTMQAKGMTSPILDAAYSSQLTYCNSVGIGKLLNLLIEGCADHLFHIASLHAALHCFHIIIDTLKEKDHLMIIGSKSLHFFQLALWSITSKMEDIRSVWPSGVKTALEIMISLIYRNDLMILKGVDVANILVGVGSISNQLERCSEGEDLCEDIYILNCGVLNALLRQYSKHLYGCVPSFNCALRSMLRVITLRKCDLVGNVGKSPVTEMIREFTKVCELLPEHKDVFKKHIMYLVIDHIDILTRSNVVQPQRKKLLEPVIMSLVDCLTVYENQQLTSMVPQTGKPFLQSILKNFQKHQYKGQF